MRKLRFFGLVAVCVLTLGCSKTSSSSSEAAIQKIMSVDTIGVERAYFEHQYGPAKRIDRDVFSYDVAGCQINVKYKNAAIQSLELVGITEQCNFDTSSIYLNGSALNLTFSKLIDVALDWRVQEACYYLCGNAFDPVYGIFVDETPHSMQFVQYRAQTVAAGDAQQAIVAAIQQNYPSVDLASGDLSAIPAQNFKAMWSNAFRDAKVTSIRFGFDLN